MTVELIASTVAYAQIPVAPGCDGRRSLPTAGAATPVLAGGCAVLATDRRARVRADLQVDLPWLLGMGDNW
jgi:hypothetical protein